MKDYQRFTKAVYFWVNKLGLLDWEIKVEKARFSKGRTELACVYMDWKQKSALIQWNTRRHAGSDWNTPEEVALHEVLHILLNSCMNSAISTGDVCNPCTDSEEHGVIKRLMRVLKDTQY